MKTIEELLNQSGTGIIDVRTQEEFDIEHYPGAILIPLHTIPTAVEEIKEMKKPLLIYCRSGNRSAQAVAFLRQHGVEEIYDGGGLFDLYAIKNN